MASKTLTLSVPGKYRFCYRVVNRRFCMTGLAVFNCDVVHCIMAHPALYVKSAIIVRIRMCKARIPIRYPICRECFSGPVRIMAGAAFRDFYYRFFLDRIITCYCVIYYAFLQLDQIYYPCTCIRIRNIHSDGRFKALGDITRITVTLPL